MMLELSEKNFIIIVESGVALRRRSSCVRIKSI